MNKKVRNTTLIASIGGLLLLSTLLFTSVSSAGTQQGVFWLKCPLSHRLPDDPIVYPNSPGAAHSHDFLGNRTTDAFSTYESMVNQGTTCKLVQDTAAYWAPSLVGPNGEVPVVNVAIYYRGIVGQTQAQPADFKLIAGATAGTPSGTTGKRQVGWSCVGDGTTIYAGIPACVDKRIKANVAFPECWDGINLDFVDHHSHVEYARQDICPSTHPVMLPRIELHITYDTTGGVGYRLSSDSLEDIPGTSLHADFWNTWDQGVLERLVEFCINQDQPCKNLTAIPIGA